ncbi:nucleoporin, Nup155-like, partial [Kipferlia bialata]|eukprot:g13239.t1
MPKTSIEGLKGVNSLVDAAYKRDRESYDLAALLSASYSDQYTHADSFSVDQVVPLPDALRDQLQNVQARSYMGVLPEINRAWLSVDNVLYLWEPLAPQ